MQRFFLSSTASPLLASVVDGSLFDLCSAVFEVDCTLWQDCSPSMQQPSRATATSSKSLWSMEPTPTLATVLQEIQHCNWDAEKFEFRIHPGLTTQTSTTTWNRKMTDLSTRRKYKRYRPFAPCAPSAWLYPFVHPFWLKLPWYYKYYKTATVWRVFCCPWCVSQCTSPRLPRHFAAEMGHVEVVRRLCDLKADVEAEKTQGGRSQGGSIPGWTAFLWHSLIQKLAVVITGKERHMSLCVCLEAWR